MAYQYFYVYSPQSGEILSLDCYCHVQGCNTVPPCGTGCNHTIVGGSGYCCPIDLGWYGVGTDMIFRGSSNIKSIKIVHIGNVCATDPSPWTDGVKVHLYAQPNQVCWFGEVLYGHLQNRAPNGRKVNRPSSGWAEYLGELPRDCACSCSRGIHVHMECRGGVRTSKSCHDQVYTSSWLYRWYLDPGSC